MSTDKAKEIGRRIREARLRKGLLQPDLAKMLKLSTSTISRYEKGIVSDIKLPILESIAKALDINLDYLLLSSDNIERFYQLEETDSLMSEAFSNPNYQILLDASKNLTNEQLESLINLVEVMVKNNE